jgi:hypothetical protein
LFGIVSHAKIGDQRFAENIEPEKVVISAEFNVHWSRLFIEVF